MIKLIMITLIMITLIMPRLITLCDPVVSLYVLIAYRSLVITCKTSSRLGRLCRTYYGMSHEFREWGAEDSGSADPCCAKSMPGLAQKTFTNWLGNQLICHDLYITIFNIPPSSTPY